MMRPTVRKLISQEGQISMNIDVNSDIGNDANIKLQHRTIRSKTKMVTRRLIRTFQMAFVVAVVNLPIYLMLIFKDWIDQ